MVTKYIKDGQVGVLYSPGYGAGWSTWGNSALAVDSALVEAYINGGVEALRKITEEKYPGEYLGGIGQIELGWISEGMAFRIKEYDGSESIEYYSSGNYFVA